MNSLKKINSVCLIPEITCGQQCPYCYEKHKKYGIPLSQELYMNFVKKSIQNLPSLTEVLIDYNGLESVQLLKSLIELIPQVTTRLITTTLIGFDKAKELDAIFNISFHGEKDIPELKRIITAYPEKIGNITLMAYDLSFLEELKALGIPVYVMVDKFSAAWKHMLPAQIYTSINELNVDNCLLTRVNQQECPASTQINLYRDGSVRRCPYQPEEPANADYSKGCNLIGEDK